jgi:hypothetical protein
MNGWIGLGATLREDADAATVIAAADALASVGMSPALLARVAEAVRAAGIEAVVALPKVVPDPAQERVVRGYLVAGAGPDIERDAAMARWLGTVCVHLAVRRAAGRAP